jgi:predicted Zn-dependent peptidase
MKTKNNPNRIRILFFVFVFNFLTASSVNSFNLDERVVQHTLANGLRILILERPMSPTVSVQIRHLVGAVDEVPGKTGVAHLLEHMMFKGTRSIGTRDFHLEYACLEKVFAAGEALDAEKRKKENADPTSLQKLEKNFETAQKDADTFAVKSEIDRLYKENGAVHHNASTSHDMTSYYLSLPANKLELWARIESDQMMNPVFRNFYSERNVVMEERRQSIESKPSSILLERFLTEAFSTHPYGKPVIGFKDDLEFLSPHDLKSFFQTYYTPANTVIAVVGAVSAPAAISLIKKYFGKIPPSHLPTRKISPEPTQNGERRINVVLSSNPEILIGYHKPALPAHEDYIFDIIDTLLSRGRTSRLYKIIVEQKGLALSINTMNGLPGNRSDNLFVFHAKTRAPHTCRDIENAIDSEIEKIKHELVSLSELEKIKNQIKMDYIQSLDSNSALASQLSYYQLMLGDYRYIQRHTEMIDKITPEEIMQTARKYLNRNNRTVATLTKGPAQ